MVVDERDSILLQTNAAQTCVLHACKGAFTYVGIEFVLKRKIEDGSVVRRTLQITPEVVRIAAEPVLEKVVLAQEVLAEPAPAEAESDL